MSAYPSSASLALLSPARVDRLQQFGLSRCAALNLQASELRTPDGQLRLVLLTDGEISRLGLNEAPADQLRLLLRRLAECGAIAGYYLVDLDALSAKLWFRESWAGASADNAQAAHLLSARLSFVERTLGLWRQQTS